jgi:hypothetical protein
VVAEVAEVVEEAAREVVAEAGAVVAEAGAVVVAAVGQEAPAGWKELWAPGLVAALPPGPGKVLRATAAAMPRVERRFRRAEKAS